MSASAFDLIRLYFPGLLGHPLSTCPSASPASPADRTFPWTSAPSTKLLDSLNAIPLSFWIECPDWHCRAEGFYLVEKYTIRSYDPLITGLRARRVLELYRGSLGHRVSRMEREQPYHEWP
jgi:hypothetical protein